MSSNTIRWEPRYGIHLALIESGDTQKELADRLGWSEARLSKIIAGKQRLLVEDLVAIAGEQSKDYSWYLEPPVNEAKGRYLSWRQRGRLFDPLPVAG